MKPKLALHGGPKTITAAFDPYRSHGHEEARAAAEVVQSGVLSRFYGSWDADFYGGPKVRQFERDWARHFRVKHAVSVNSATSALIAAVGALGIEPGDEVIVSPWTMAASATAILIWNAIPVFADIEAETFNLDARSIERCITPRTKAIMVPDIFGHAAELDSIMRLARKHGLRVIEDASQAPGAFYKGKHVGTIADIGVYSLNYHKHIHTGEGGMSVTDDPVLADRMQLIRNHGEAVVAQKPTTDFTNIIGFNFRLGEIEAAMGIEQLKKLEGLAAGRARVAGLLSEGLRKLRGIRVPVVKEGATHVYYVYPLVLDPEALGVPRAKLHAALEAEGVPGLCQGYMNIHLLPMYQKRIAYGTKGFPWTSDCYAGDVSYQKGICPVAENLHDAALISLSPCMHAYSDREVGLVLEAFGKVWDQLDQLR